MGVQHDQGEGYQQLIGFRTVSQSDQVGKNRIPITYIYSIPNILNLVLVYFIFFKSVHLAGLIEDPLELRRQFTFCSLSHTMEAQIKYVPSSSRFLENTFRF